ncbi:hypothetical protein [Nocardia tengchongensis]|uniref:hypothetical protein n=1 Tax=Nocardia tengchongensis TaxID=2055889 RepID=UPI00364F9E86
MTHFNNHANSVFAQQQGTFNGDVVTYVNHFRQKSDGRICPAGNCGASPLSMVRMVWQEQTRLDGIGTSLLALALTPPIPPHKPDRTKLIMWAVIVDLVVLCCGGSALNHGTTVSMLINLAIVATSIAIVIMTKRADERQFQNNLSEFNRIIHVWNSAWICLRCGTVSASKAELGYP